MSDVGTTYHRGVDIRGAIRRLGRSRAKWAVGITDGEGNTKTREAAIDALMDELASGRRVLPVGKPCEGWSYETGCPGHPKEPVGE